MSIEILSEIELLKVSGFSSILTIIIGFLFFLIFVILVICSISYLVRNRDSADMRRYLLIVFATPFLTSLAFSMVYLTTELAIASCIDGVRVLGDIFYFSVVTITTLGYGDLKPIGTCRFIAASEAYIGYMLFSLMAASFYSTIRRLVV